MMRRGLKRKVDKMLDNFEEEPDPYQQGLGDFQTMARKRESMRLKNQVTNSASDSTNPCQSWEKSLQDQIHVEQQILEGTAKFIHACKNEQQTLEASKRLQLGRLRLEMLRFDLARSKRGRGSPQNHSKSMPNQLSRPSYAGVSLSDIRIPLMWKRKDHLNDAGDKRKFSVFCIARIGSQIYDTRLINSVDRSSTDITIEDVILFSRVAPHFELTIELYARQVEDGSGFSALSGSSVASTSAEVGKMILATPQKICRSISRAVGKKLLESSNFMDNDGQPKKKLKASEQNNSDLYYTNVGPKFEMIASATLTLEDCSDDIKSHEFYVEEFRSCSNENSAQNWTESVKTSLPLFGQFCCRLAAVPYCCEGPVQTGYIFVRKVEGSDNLGQPEKMWGRLVDWKLSLWCDEQEYDEGTKPIIEIPINRETCILEEGNDTILIINHLKDESQQEEKSVKSKGKSVSWESTPALTKMSFEVVFNNSLISTEREINLKENYDIWLVHLLQHAADHRRWKIAATSKMAVYSPKIEKKKIDAPSVTWDHTSYVEPGKFAKRSRPLRSGSMYFPRIGSLNPSIVKKHKREAQKSFRRTKSKLVLMYNLTGTEADTSS